MLFVVGFLSGCSGFFAQAPIAIDISTRVERTVAHIVDVYKDGVDTTAYCPLKDVTLSVAFADGDDQDGGGLGGVYTTTMILLLSFGGFVFLRLLLNMRKQ